MKRKFLSVVGLVSTVALFAMLQGGGTGGCGGSGGGGGGGGGTPTAGVSASGAGGVAALTAAISSSLGAAMGGGGALVLKSEGTGDDDLSCTCDDATGICTCDDEDSESEGGIDCDFEDLPGEDDFEVCGEGDTSMGSFSFSGTVTIDNAEFDECGMHLTFSGTVSYSGSFSLDCEGEPTGTVQYTTSSACSGLTAVDEDGTSHTVGLNVTDTEGSLSGTICIDGTEYDAATLDTACNEDSCEDECVTSCEGGGTSPALKSEEDSTCEETCESTCEGDDDGDYDSGGGTDAGSSCEDASVTDKAEARTQLQSYDVDPLPQEVSEAIEEACAASDSDVETFVAAFLCALDIDSSLASDTDIQEDVDNLEDIDTSDLAGTCADAEGGGVQGCTDEQNNACKETAQMAEDGGIGGAVDATTCVDPETWECSIDCSETSDEATCLAMAGGNEGVTCEGSVCNWIPGPMP